jgi:tetratricopeptide (TPR) repeat protein
LYKIRFYILLLLAACSSGIYGQDPKLQALSDNVLRLKDGEERQDRHVAINDSFHRAKAFKMEWKYLDLIQEDCKKAGDKKLEAIVINSKGNFFLGTGNYISGIETFNKGAVIFDSLRDFAGLSMIHANIGNAYFYVGDLDKALFYYKTAVSDYKKVTDKKPDSETKLANCYNSLGSIYSSKKDYVYGKTYFDLAYQIWAKHGDSLSIAYILNNYANLFYENEKNDSAFFYFNKALQLKMRHGDNYDKADAHNNLAQFFLTNNKLQLSVDHSFKSLNFLDSNIYSRQLITCYHHLTEAYKRMKDYRNELKYYKLYKIATDSSNVQVQKSELDQMELKHEFDRVHLSDSIKAVEEIKLKDAKLSEKKQQTYFLVFILFLTMVVLGLIYSRFNITRKQKKIIEHKNKEITDSINYARKIQQSILPNESYIEKELNKLNKRN